MSRDCLACPRGEKNEAEYHWHPGAVGVYPDCEPCLRTSLPTNLKGYKKTKYEAEGADSSVSGYATPIDDPSVKIVTEDDLDDYLETTA